MGEAIRDATMEWKGLKVTIKLTVKNRQAVPSVVPSASSLVIRALYPNGMPETDGENRVHDGDVAYDEIYEVAKVMRGRSMSRTMAGTGQCPFLPPRGLPARPPAHPPICSRCLRASRASRALRASRVVSQ